MGLPQRILVRFLLSENDTKGSLLLKIELIFSVQNVILNIQKKQIASTGDKVTTFLVIAHEIGFKGKGDPNSNGHVGNNRKGYL